MRGPNATANGMWLVVGLCLAGCSGGADAPTAASEGDAGADAGMMGGGDAGSGSSSGGADAGPPAPVVLRNRVVTSGEHRILGLAVAPEGSASGVTVVLMAEALPGSMRVSVVRVDEEGAPLEPPAEVWSGGTGATPWFQPSTLVWDPAEGRVVAHFEVTEWDGTQTVVHRFFTTFRAGEPPQTRSTDEAGEGAGKLVLFQTAGRGYLRILASPVGWTVDKLGLSGHVETSWAVEGVAPPGADTLCDEAADGFVCVTLDGQNYVRLTLGPQGQVLSRTELPLVAFQRASEEWRSSGLIRLRHTGTAHQLLWNRPLPDNPRRVDLVMTTLAADGSVVNSVPWAENVAWHGAQGDLGDLMDDAGPGWSVWSASPSEGAGYNSSVRGRFAGPAAAGACDLSDLRNALDRAVASPVTVPLRGLDGPAWAVLWADSRMDPHPAPGGFETNQLIFQRVTDACPEAPHPAP